MPTVDADRKPDAFADKLASARAEALTDHYQQTVELVSRTWDRRNRQFLILIAVLAAAVLVALGRDQLEPAMRIYLQKTWGLAATKAPPGQMPADKAAADKAAADRAAEDRAAADKSTSAQDKQPDGKAGPDDVQSRGQDPSAERLIAFLQPAIKALLALLAVAIFYLMASLYHSTGMIIGGYTYLGMLEREVRAELDIGRDKIAFTREGPFFRVTGRHVTWLIGICYRAVLLVLLMLFFALRLFSDLVIAGPLPLPGWEAGTPWYSWFLGSVSPTMEWLRPNFLVVIDGVAAVVTLSVFFGYLRLSPMEEEDVREEIGKLAAGQKRAPEPPVADVAPLPATPAP